MDEKGFGRRVWDFLGSREISVFIFIMGLTYTFFLIIFGLLVSTAWVNSISRLLPFKVLYLLFFLNLIICEIKWMPVIVRKCRRLKYPEATEDFQRFRHKIEVSGQGSGVRSLEGYLRWRGYKVQWPGETNSPLPSSQSSLLLYAYKGRFSPIGNLLFHIAFLLLLFGVGVSVFFRFAGSARVTEGYPFSGSANEYGMISASPLTFPPDVSFSLSRLTSRFWKGELLFTDLRADVSYPGGEGSAWLSSPLRINGARVTVNSIGITPMYLLKDNEGKELDRAFVNLAVFAPGTEDHFQIPGYPHQIFISFYPDYELKDGKAATRSMNVKNPVYYLRIFRGRLPVYSGLLKPGEEATFESLRLSFPEMKYWGEFRIVKDPGFIFIWGAFILFGIGLSWRLLFYRREVAIIIESSGVYLYGSSDYYPNLFGNKLRVLSEMMDDK